MRVLLFVGRRAAALVSVLLIVSFAVYSLLDLSPGGPVLGVLGLQGTSDPAAVKAVRAEYHLDQPFIVRYFRWLGNVARLRFGRSTNTGESVTHVIAERLPTTLGLALFAFILVLVIGVPAGIVAALRRGGMFDRLITLAAVIATSAPAFAVATVLIYLLGVRFAVLPPFGPGIGLADQFRHLILPAASLAFGATAIIIRQARAAALDVSNQDYITFARARDLSRRRILWSYILRNTMLPVITVSGLLLIGMVSGVIFIETVFGLPGLGSLLVDSINSDDLPVVQGLTLLTAAFVVIGNLLVDLIGLALDPRTREAGAVR